MTNRNRRLRDSGLLGGLALASLLVAGVPAAAQTAPRYLDDGARQNGRGGWDLPDGGACAPDAGIATRTECMATRFAALDAGGCTAAGGQTTLATTSYCRDLARTSAGACVDDPPGVDFPQGIDRLWSPADGVCVLTLRGYDRNRAVCEIQQGGTWSAWGAGKCLGAWRMPDGSTYDPPLLTGTVNPGPGDQCLRCHRGDTEWNSDRARDAEGYLLTGHKNASRRVSTSGPLAGLPWGGPAFECSNPLFTAKSDCEASGSTWDPTLYDWTDAGAALDWPTGSVDVGGPRDLYWIAGEWSSPLPGAVWAADPLPGAPLRPGVAWACARCHTTGWTGDATLEAEKEPERSFPGITWDGASDALAGQVDLAGGDGHPMSSWDLYGVTCSRCHGSAVAAVDGICSIPNLVDPATCAAAGGTWTDGPPLPGVPGLNSTHTADLTSVDGVNGGYCTNLRIRNATRSICEYFGGQWFAQCSDPRWATATICRATAGCVNPGNGHGLPYPNEASCEAASAGECTIPYFTSQALCVAGGGSWTGAGPTWWTAKAPGTWTSSYCTLGTCSDPGHSEPGPCMASGATWTSAWSDLTSCMDAGGDWASTKHRRGQLITQLCTECHRQEAGGVPADPAHPGTALKVGPTRGTVGFTSWPVGNQFLNSPHARFTGSFAEIGTATLGGGYASPFLDQGVVADTGNGCTGCHDVHRSTVGSTGQGSALRRECTDCHPKDLDQLRHPTGTGTPVENRNRPNDACVACHMPEGMHLFRIQTSGAYSTLPPAALTATADANVAPEGTFAAAVWLDVDTACGRCHGGGVDTATGTGAISAGSRQLTLGTGEGGAFTAGERVKVAGAGAFSVDELGALVRGDFESYIVSIAGDVLTLAGEAPAGVAGADVEQNPVTTGGYLSRSELAADAVGMHDDLPVVDFSTTLGSPNTLTVNANASATTCRGSLAECDSFTWDWGDGSPLDTTSGVFASHTYATGGVKTITLTVEDYGVGTGSRTRNVTVVAPDLPPVVGGTCTLDANTWIATVTDASTDDHGVVQVTVNWGDGSAIANDTTPPFGPFTHSFITAGTFTIAHRAIDTIGQQSTDTSCVVTTAGFSIGGRVFRSDGVTPVASATVTIKRGLVTVRTLATAANGSYLATGLRPGAHTVEARRTGYVFPAPTAVTIGPDQLAVDVLAVTP